MRVVEGRMVWADGKETKHLVDELNGAAEELRRAGR